MFQRSNCFYEAYINNSQKHTKVPRKHIYTIFLFIRLAKYVIENLLILCGRFKVKITQIQKTLSQATFKLDPFLPADYKQIVSNSQAEVTEHNISLVKNS